MTEGNQIVPSKRKSKKDIESDGGISIPDEIIDKVGGKDAVLRLISHHTESFSGPIPHPRIIEHYKKIMPDAPKKIFLMAERQQKHRIALENSVILGDVRRADLGLKLGFVLFGILSLGGISLLFVGKDVQGYSVLAASFLGGIVNFIRVGRERDRQITQQPPKNKPAPRKKAKEKTRGKS